MSERKRDWQLKALHPKVSSVLSLAAVLRQPFIPTRLGLWLLLASLVALQHLLVIHRTQGSPTMLSMAFLVWWGAWLCTEDQVGNLQPRPTRTGLFLGSFILVLCVLRSSNEIHPENLFTLLAPLEGFALAILLVPFNQLRSFWSSLIILTLLPLKIIVSRLLPEQLISLATARSSGLLLQGIGMEVSVDGTVVMLPNGGVIVHGPCNGTEMICMVLIVALTFLLAFPLSHWRHRALVLVASPLVAMATNSIRIAILALIAATPSPHSDVMFDFFHLEAGSLLFSGVAVSLFALLYLAVLNKELTSRVLKEV